MQSYLEKKIKKSKVRGRSTQSIIAMLKWTRTGSLSLKNSPSIDHFVNCGAETKPAASERRGNKLKPVEAFYLTVKTRIRH